MSHADRDSWDEDMGGGHGRTWDDEEVEVVEKLVGDDAIDDVDEFLHDDGVIDGARVNAHEPLSERLSLHTPRQYISSSLSPGLLRACTAGRVSTHGVRL